MYTIEKTVPILLLFILGIVIGCDSGGSSEPEPELINGVALSGNDQSDVAAVATHQEGEWLVAFSREDPSQVSDVVYGTGDGTQVTVTLDERGRPERGVIGPYIFAFGNYDGNRADVALLNTNTGEIDRYSKISLGPDLEGLGVSNKSALSPAQAFTAAGAGISAFTCTLAVIDISGFSLGGCAVGLLLTAAGEALEETRWGETAQWVGFGVDAVECAGDYGISCASALVDLGQIVFDEDETQVEENEDEFAQAAGVARFGGIWRYRNISQGWFVMEEERSLDAIYDSQAGCYRLIILNFLGIDDDVFRYERLEDGFEIEAEFELLEEDVLTATRLNDGANFFWDRDPSQDPRSFIENECQSSGVIMASKALGG